MNVALTTKKKLQFKADGTFKIVQFTDLHWQNGEQEDLRTLALMERVLATEQPDLVVFTGDLIYSKKCRDECRSMEQVVAAVVRSGTPWAAVLGNHDSEGKVPRRTLMDTLSAQKGCLASVGPSEIEGIGNYALQVLDRQGKAQAALYFMDSGSYSSNPSVPGYDWIRESQIEWYRQQSAGFARGNQGAPLPGLVFFHIPLPEYKEVWRTQTCFGHRYEDISSPRLNSGLFAAMIEEGGIRGTFCGHDHINDFEGPMLGIRLCYGRASGYNTYGRWLYQRGARIIVLQEGKSGFDTWIRQANGKAQLHPRPHKPRRFGKLLK